ncbi:hypothetical protein ETD86_45865 [Nonomuraea turkmeniaca]|uniref:Uncharacterized protein n=1 Tax=Nonomuraea turkmeniaca TaxID=103838 RepID=A0A5S4EZ11_9ACTN|nr:hypothetical protein [Nonomuraea turkmeniaca]TMR08903.1 hypothetical protein ETD86_45865 [Nonomuraea turkmeniaca]
MSCGDAMPAVPATVALDAAALLPGHLLDLDNVYVQVLDVKRRRGKPISAQWAVLTGRNEPAGPPCVGRLAIGRHLTLQAIRRADWRAFTGQNGPLI